MSRQEVCERKAGSSPGVGFIYLQSTPKRQWIFFIQKEFEPSSAANAARIGRKRRQEAAVSERRRLKGADRKSARERPVQVRELA